MQSIRNLLQVKTQHAVNFQLVPSRWQRLAAIDINGRMHTIVLDTVEQITENNRNPGYEIGDHKLVFKNTYDNEDNGQPKQYIMKANREKVRVNFTKHTLMSTWIR